MKTMMTLGAVLLAGCMGEANEGQDGLEVGITYKTVADNAVVGTFTTAYGSVEFKSIVSSDGVVDVSFDRGAGEFGSHVDWNTLTANFQFAEGFKITEDDRFLLSALASTLENELGRKTPAADNLFRQAGLWGIQTVGVVPTTHIVGDGERGWTTICGRTSYTFPHDGSTGGSHSWNENLACGPTEKSNPCRARCGSGCTAVWGGSAWTKDCGSHDRCEQHHGAGVNADCSNELSWASDDYTFAPNC
jgi:hypothetical protein